MCTVRLARCYDSLHSSGPPLPQMHGRRWWPTQQHGSARELPHTVVDSKFRGEGLSKPLIKFALDDARGDNLSVVPSCPAVARYIVQHPEYKDLVE